MTKQEAHSSIKIPPMEYFTLDRAASILQCDIDDLLHYGVIGAIPLCVMMRGFPSALIFMGGKDIQDPIEFYHEHKGNSSFLFREGNYISHFNSLLTEYDVYRTDSGLILFNGMAHGLWCVGYSEIESLLYYGEAKLTDATPFRPFGCDIFLEKTGVSCHIVSKKYFDLNWLPLLNRKLAKKIKFNSSINRKPETEITITSSDIFIARDTILKLKDAIDTGEPMKSMINGGVTIPPEPGEQKQIASTVNSNKVGEFLEMLIRCVPDLGDDVMKATANKRHSILSAFLEKQQKEGKFNNMKMPSSATIEKYFKI